MRLWGGAGEDGGGAGEDGEVGLADSVPASRGPGVPGKLPVTTGPRPGASACGEGSLAPRMPCRPALPAHRPGPPRGQGLGPPGIPPPLPGTALYFTSCCEGPVIVAPILSPIGFAAPPLPPFCPSLSSSPLCVHLPRPPSPLREHLSQKGCGLGRSQ